MKNLLLIFSVFIFSNINLSAQSPIPPGNPPENFFTIKSRWDAHYDSLRIIIGDSALNNDESDYGTYRAWQNYWEPIVSPTGDFMPAYKAANNITQRRISNPPITSTLNSNWVELGPTDQPLEGPSILDAGSTLGGTGVVHFITIDPQNVNHLVTGSPAGGLFFSTDGGDNWLNANTDQLPILNIAHCAIDPKNGDNWFIATGDKTAMADGRHDIGFGASIGVFRKLGVGFNWQRIADEFDLGASDGAGGIWWGWEVKKILIDSTNSNVMYVATSFGIFKTTNALEPNPNNVNWIRLQGTGGTDSNFAFDDIEFKPGLSSTIYACRDFNFYLGATLPTANIIMSIDGGSTWSNFDNGINLTGVQRITIETSPANPDMLYALTATQSYGAIKAHLYTINTATQTSWVDKGQVPLGIYFNGVSFSHVKSLCVSPIVLNPNEKILFGDYYPIYQSVNGGSTWTLQSGNNQTHNDIHHIIFSPDGTTLWAATDGGVWKSTDGGINWVAKNKGLGVETIYRMAWSVTDSNLGLQGNQDCGTNFFNGTNWKHVWGGDGLMPMIDYKDPKYMYASSQSGVIKRSEDRGVSFPFAANGASGSDWATFEVMNTSNPKIYYQAGSDVFRTTDRGNFSSWRRISNFASQAPGYKPLTLYVAPSNSDYLYAFLIGNNPVRLFKTTNANDTNPANVSWIEIQQHSSDAFVRWISDVVVDDSDPEIIWVTYTGFNNISDNFIDKKIWKFDGHTQTWTNLTAGLPDVDVSSIVREKGSDGGLYIATNGSGVFYTNNKFLATTPNNAWQLFNTGLPNVQIREIDINYTANKIRAATFGRGLWESDLACPPPSLTMRIKG